MTIKKKIASTFGVQIILKTSTCFKLSIKVLKVNISYKITEK